MCLYSRLRPVTAVLLCSHSSSPLSFVKLVPHWGRSLFFTLKLWPALAIHVPCRAIGSHGTIVSSALTLLSPHSNHSATGRCTGKGRVSPYLFSSNSSKFISHLCSPRHRCNAGGRHSQLGKGWPQAARRRRLNSEHTRAVARGDTNGRRVLFEADYSE